MKTFKDVQPINGKILVLDDRKDEKTSSGIFLPEQRKDEAMVIGTVIETSPIKMKAGEIRPADVSPGDRVIYSFHAGGRNVEIENDNIYRIVDPVDLLGIIVE